ncbi:DUF58 domain-containing protein [Psychrobacter jeotgali]|uniref:DUF58 domain-containing protein n=1 Tax=Psychrobacter jeotgali TaxID=179010 RepID=UPI001917FDF6|nr:DUF58 domain-containing protein [Psychrobacter jeotgali]
MNQAHAQHTPSSQIQVQPKLSFWQRLRQFQPSTKLVKIVLLWWLVLVVATALDMTSGFGSSALESVSNLLYYLCALALVVLVIACVLDIIMLIAISQASSYQVSRKFPSNVPIYHEIDIEVSLSFSGASFKPFNKLGFIKSIRLEFYDDYPNHLTLLDAMSIAFDMPLLTPSANSIENTIENQPTSTPTTAPNNQANTITICYPVLPSERGTGYFGDSYLRIASPMRLWRRALIIPANDTSTVHSFHGSNYQSNDKPKSSSTITQPAHSAQYLRVLADFSGLLNNQLSVIFEKSRQAGVQALTKEGQGSDFLDLREYSAGDAIRQIDWKASSRLRKLMSKSYEDDNDQDLVFLLDCGEQMRHQDVYHDESAIDETINNEGLDSIEIARYGRYFDKVLNAVLLLAYIANKQSDRVGLMTFGGIEVFLPPKKGSTLIRDLLNETADIKPTMQTGDYLMAAQDLMKKLKKRSIIVLITNTRAEASDELIQAVNLLSKRHNVVFANLMEQAIYERLYGDVIPENMDDALLYHALVDYQQSRQQLQQRLSKQTGALCLQTMANQLPTVLIQAYLSLSRR